MAMRLLTPLIRPLDGCPQSCQARISSPQAMTGVDHTVELGEFTCGVEVSEPSEGG